MDPKILVSLLVAFIQICITKAQTKNGDFIALNALKDIWENTPPNWVGADPCGSMWDGIGCTNQQVTSIKLSSMGLRGQLSSDISSLLELQILDLSYNEGLNGALPTSIGNLKKLTTLILIGCKFYGPIPYSIGSLPLLTYLSLNSNGFNDQIPPSIGNLSNLYWLDLSDNQLVGSIPISSVTSPGLDKLLNAKHFHLGNNQLSGNIPPKLFSSKMKLIHMLLYGNQLTGSIPDTLGLVQTLEVVRFDGNHLSGSLPSNLNNLTSVMKLILSNNKLTGLVPDLTGMNVLAYLDMSNNSFVAADFPSWLSSLWSLETLMMECTQLQGQVPPELFSLPNLQTVVLKNNSLNGTLNMSTSNSGKLQLVDVQINFISNYVKAPGENVHVILVRNIICQETGVTQSYCTASEPHFSYKTQPNNCVPPFCPSKQTFSPNCTCAYPYTGMLFFTFDLGNKSIFGSIEKSLTEFFKSYQLPVDSVSISNPKLTDEYIDMNLEVFPDGGQDRFNRTVIFEIGFVLSNQTYQSPKPFLPFFFIGNPYQYFADEATSSKSSNTGRIIGAAAGGSVLLLVLLLAGLYAYHQKKRAERATECSHPFAHWDLTENKGSVPQLKGARCFSFEELKKYTNSFSEANDIGSGGYGKVCRGTLPSGELIAIKRARQGSMQGGQEFKTEIELLSRVHHKNLVSLLGFCFERGEQMLVYEFLPNGTLRDSLSGKTGIRMDWMRRVRVTLGAARGLAYLHELANPPIIHRDIKSTNILLDEHLNAKVADFGLSKPISDGERGHVTTQVKGTMGYLDPEYYMTQQLTEKSDVYSFGVVMLELITARRPIERGKYIVREVRMAMDRTKDLYNLLELLDPGIGLDTTLKGLEKFVDLAMNCVQESGADRPTMGEVVKEIEHILQLAGINPNAELASTSATYKEDGKGSYHPYSKEFFDYSGALPPSMIEPH